MKHSIIKEKVVDPNEQEKEKINQNDDLDEFEKDELLKKLNVLDYFCQVSNPFYDKNSNNELIKMQRKDKSVLE